MANDQEFNSLLTDAKNGDQNALREIVAGYKKMMYDTIVETAGSAPIDRKKAMIIAFKVVLYELKNVNTKEELDNLIHESAVHAGKSAVDFLDVLENDAPEEQVEQISNTGIMNSIRPAGAGSDVPESRPVANEEFHPFAGVGSASAALESAAAQEEKTEATAEPAVKPAVQPEEPQETMEEVSEKPAESVEEPAETEEVKEAPAEETAAESLAASVSEEQVLPQKELPEDKADEPELNVMFSHTDSVQIPEEVQVEQEESVIEESNVQKTVPVEKKKEHMVNPNMPPDPEPKKKKGGILLVVLLLLVAAAGGYWFLVKNRKTSSAPASEPVQETAAAETAATQTETAAPAETASPEQSAEPEPSETPEAAETATPEPTEAADTVIGTAQVLVENLNMRSGPGQSFDKVGTASANTVYDVLEIQDAEGYTWYRVGEEEWFADNGNWVTFQKN